MIEEMSLCLGRHQEDGLLIMALWRLDAIFAGEIKM